MQLVERAIKDPQADKSAYSKEPMTTPTYVPSKRRFTLFVVLSINANNNVTGETIPTFFSRLRKRGLRPDQSYFLLIWKKEDIILLILVQPIMMSNVLAIGGPRTKLLPTMFEPGSWDVICHNGRDAHGHGKPFSPFGFTLSL
jgi:hypothetical protein